MGKIFGRIQRCVDPQGRKFGKIEIDDVADPESVIVLLEEQRLYPESFTPFGTPIFSEEVCDFFDAKERALKQIYGKDYRLKATVIYECVTLDIKREDVDSLEGIHKGIKDLASLTRLIRDRSLYNWVTGRHGLNQFLIFGRYILECTGGVGIIHEKNEIPGVQDVLTLEEFGNLRLKGGQSEFWMWQSSAPVPEDGDSCPWCTKKFTILDLKCARTGNINGKVAHSQCVREYDQEIESKKFIDNLIKVVYDEETLTFDLLPNNGYCRRSCCANRPWFLCHTVDGDIKIGWKHSGIFIEWEENFKPFDMSIFDSEQVPKWDRGINAHGREKAYEYLKRVKEYVNTEE